MSNIKISNLTQTTATTLNDVVAIVDSGSTQTSKITIENLLSNVGGSITQQNNKNMIIASTTSTLEDRSTNTPSSNTGNNVILGSHNTTLRADDGLGNNVLLASDEATLDINTEGGMNIIGSSYSNCSITRAFGGTILSSTGSIIQSGNERAVIIAGNNSTTQSTFTSAQIANNTCVINNSTEAFIAGSRDTSINLAGGNSGSIIGSKSSSISLPSASAEINGIYSSNNSEINTDGIHSVILNSTGTNITGSVQGATMVSTDTQTAVYDWTTHTDHLHSFGQTSNGYKDNGISSSFTIDWNDGNTQEIEMNGDTTLTFNNVRNGATYVLKVVNGGTHTISSVSAAGYTIKCEGGSIPNITNSGEDLCILEVIGTDIFVRHFADFSTP